MMILSVLLIALGGCLEIANSRRLTDDLISNEIDVNPSGNMAFRELEWVKISQPPSDVRAKFGGRLELYCEAMGSPPPVIQWYKGNKRITEHDSLDDSLIAQNFQPGLAKVASRLIINYLLSRHQDLYSCVATSGNQIASASSDVVVANSEGKRFNFTQLVSSGVIGAYHVPKVTFWAKNYMDIIGNTVLLPCKTVGNPNPTLRWYDPEGQIIGRDTGSRISVLPDGELRIKSVTWSDMGVYICEVKNKIGDDRVETFLYPMQSESTDLQV